MLPKLGPLPQMSHVDAIAVLLELIKLTAIRVQQAQRVARGGRIEPIRKARVPALVGFTRKKSSVRRATANSLNSCDEQAQDRAM